MPSDVDDASADGQWLQAPFIADLVEHCLDRVGRPAGAADPLLLVGQPGSGRDTVLTRLASRLGSDSRAAGVLVATAEANKEGLSLIGERPQTARAGRLAGRAGRVLTLLSVALAPVDAALGVVTGIAGGGLSVAEDLLPPVDSGTTSSKPKSTADLIRQLREAASDFDAVVLLVSGTDLVSPALLARSALRLRVLAETAGVPVLTVFSCAAEAVEELTEAHCDPWQVASVPNVTAGRIVEWWGCGQEAAHEIEVLTGGRGGLIAALRATLGADGADGAYGADGTDGAEGKAGEVLARLRGVIDDAIDARLGRVDAGELSQQAAVVRALELVAACGGWAPRGAWNCIDSLRNVEGDLDALSRPGPGAVAVVDADAAGFQLNRLVSHALAGPFVSSLRLDPDQPWDRRPRERQLELFLQNFTNVASPGVANYAVAVAAAEAAGLEDAVRRLEVKRKMKLTTTRAEAATLLQKELEAGLGYWRSQRLMYAGSRLSNVLEDEQDIAPSGLTTAANALRTAFAEQPDALRPLAKTLSRLGSLQPRPGYLSEELTEVLIAHSLPWEPWELLKAARRAAQNEPALALRATGFATALLHRPGTGLAPQAAAAVWQASLMMDDATRWGPNMVLPLERVRKLASRAHHCLACSDTVDAHQGAESLLREAYTEHIHSTDGSETAMHALVLR